MARFAQLDLAELRILQAALEHASCGCEDLDEQAQTDQLLNEVEDEIDAWEEDC